MKEFRINNYIVDYETEPYYFKIEEIKRNEQGILACYYRNGSCWSIAPDRVELTEEILLKCGFEWSIQHQSYKHKNFKYVIDFYNSHPQFNSSVCFLNKEHRSGENLICIHYLHQLQNLYFALTNEELTVNL